MNDWLELAIRAHGWSVFEPDTQVAMSFMLAAQGAAKWPRQGPSRTALVFDEELPLMDSSIDRILAIHSIEHAENPPRDAHGVLARIGAKWPIIACGAQPTRRLGTC